MAMPRVTVPPGTRFGKLVVTGEGPPMGKRNERSLECVCECGIAVTPLLSNLRKAGGTRSCGCDRAAVLVAQQQAGRTHGMRDSKVYSIWHGMKQRCLNPRAKEYKWYGARGIILCEAWHDFEAFYADMGDPPGDEYTIERDEVNGNYELANCRWATMQEQSVNRRDNVYLEHGGVRKTISQWADSLNIPRATLYYRRRMNWSDQEIIFGKA